MYLLLAPDHQEKLGYFQMGKYAKALITRASSLNFNLKEDIPSLVQRRSTLLFRGIQ